MNIPKAMLPALLALGVLLPADGARSSQVFLEAVPLGEVVQRSRVVVVARAAAPFEVVEEVDITPAGEAKDPKRYPPFHQVRQRFVVDRVLHASLDAPKLEAGAVIVVADAAEESDLELHVKLHVERVSKSPLYDAYQRTADADPAKDSVILFLRGPAEAGGPLRFAVVGAWEGLAAENAVKKAIGKVYGKRTP